MEFQIFASEHCQMYIQEQLQQFKQEMKEQMTKEHRKARRAERKHRAERKAEQNAEMLQGVTIEDPELTRGVERQNKVLLKLYKRYGTAWKLYKSHFPTFATVQIKNRVRKLLGKVDD